MKALAPAILVLLYGCAVPEHPQTGAGAQHLGVPVSSVDPSVQAALPGGPEGVMVRLPERITLPASYRLMLLDGHLALVRETDPQALERAPTSMRIVTGEVARGELAYQPGLLPQELAAEVAANRESSARMDNALGTVMQRSRELSEQALELQAESRRLAEALTAAQARIRDLEATHPPGPPTPSPPSPTDPTPN